MPKNAQRTRFVGVFQVESQGGRRYEGRADVCYYYTLTIAGRKKWIKVGWKSEGYTATMAQALRIDHLQAARHGTALPERRDRDKDGLTLNQAFAVFAERHLTQIRSGARIATHVQTYVLATLGSRRLAEITTTDVNRLIATMAAKGLAPATIVWHCSHLQSIVNHTRKWGLHKLPSPTDGANIPKFNNARTRYLTRDEAAQLLASLQQRSPLWHDLAALSLATGARVGELKSLTGGAVNLAGGVMEVNGKTGRRMVILSEPATRVLRPRLVGLAPARLVFPSPIKGQLIGAGCPHFTTAVQECGLNPPGIPRRQKVVFHTLRHTFASWLAIDGVPLMVIAELMGHKTLEMTLRYAHLCPDQKRQAADVVGRALHDLIPVSAAP